jgi:hypothetical protein
LRAAQNMLHCSKKPSIGSSNSVRRFAAGAEREENVQFAV